MPGLSQLKQFEKDILSLGDESSLRAQRGEKPVIVPIPKGITVDNDAEDFVLGMPEKPLAATETVVDDDLSDITGMGSSKNKETSNEPSGPDLSSLLMPVDLGESNDEVDQGMPDLSMFMDEPEPEVVEEPVQEEEKEISIADMGLDALLAGAGFDGSDINDAFEDVSDLDSTADSLETIDEPIPEVPVKETKKDPAPTSDYLNDLPPELAFLNDIGKTPAEDSSSDFSSTGEALDLGSLGSSDNSMDMPLDFGSDASFDTPAIDNFGFENISADSFGVDSFDEPAAPSSGDFENIDFEDIGSSDSSDFNIPEDSFTDFDTPSADNEDSFDTADSLDSIGDLGSGDALDSIGDLGSLDSLDSLGATDPADAMGSIDSIGDADDFGTPDFGGDFGIDDITLPADDGDSGTGSSDTDLSPDLFADDSDSSGGFENISFDDISEEPAAPKADTGSDDAGSDFADIDLSSIDEPSFDTDSFTTSDDDFGDFGTGDSSDMLESLDTDIPDYDDIPADGFDSMDSGDSDFSSGEPSGNESLEIFDTTGMDDMDFGIPDTDSSFGSDSTSSDAGSGGDFELESFDFEIPGYSDVEVKEEVKQKPVHKNPHLDVPDFSKGIPGVELPPNSLSEEQYKAFLKNFSTYPLNVRLAFEDLIVQNEFTDDAEFEVIEKILNKAPARQVAGMLEKMLDTSIPVPRDYEHRTAEEYAAYKKSVQYQLKNKILPGILVTVLLALFSWGMFNFTKNCIIIPARATKYYKQGYTLLQADEYAQAQMKFNMAASEKMKKKWFFKYARGYREHKQFYRAAEIYQKTLIYFDHDKQAGLEYADMELNDLSNYSNAEEIVRRQLLDYHVNDEDGILMLGDIFLEWGTEKDPSKLDLAREQYLKLMQLYKPNNLYNSRMMRYYIRSDNLQQVISYQKMFEQNEKSLVPEDWTELSGYLLEKLYGPMSPSEEPLRYKIEGLRALLKRAETLDKDNPNASYNMAKYYINTSEVRFVENALQRAIEKYNKAPQLKRRDVYKYIDSYRLLGEHYIKLDDYLQAQEQYTNGITLYVTEKENAAFEGNEKIGHLYSDLADINYLLAGDYDSAAVNYKNAVDLGYDNSSIRYRLGYISYKNKNYQEALGSFMKAGEGNNKERNLLYAMGNTLSLRKDDYAAEGYFAQLISELDFQVSLAGGSLFPQTNAGQNELVTQYMEAANNYGVVLHRLAARTGDSQKNAQSIVQFQQSIRAWDSLTRNQTTMIRLEGSNLAAENIKYVTHPVVDFEPAIYLDIPKTLSDSEKI